ARGAVGEPLASRLELFFEIMDRGRNDREHEPAVSGRDSLGAGPVPRLRGEAVERPSTRAPAFARQAIDPFAELFPAAAGDKEERRRSVRGSDVPRPSRIRTMLLDDHVEVRSAEPERAHARAPRLTGSGGDPRARLTVHVERALREARLGVRLL